MREFLESNAGVISIVLGPLALWLFLRYIFTRLAKQDKLMTFPELGKTKLRMKGGNVAGIIYRQLGRDVDQETGKTFPLPDGKKAVYHHGPFAFLGYIMEVLFGVVWIGFDPYSVFRYIFSFDRFVRESDKDKYTDEKGNYIAGYSVDSDKRFKDIAHRSSETNYLANQEEYPIIIRGVETKNRAKIYIRGTVTFSAVNVLVPTVILRGNWFYAAKSTLSGAITEFAKQSDLEDFGDMPKGWNSTDKVYKSPPKNVSSGTADKDASTKPVDKSKWEEGKSLKNFITEAFNNNQNVITGMEVLAFNFEEWGLDDTTLDAAAVAKEKAQLEAEARIIKAKGIATSTLLVGNAKNEVQKNLVLNTSGISATGAQVLSAQAYSTLQASTVVLGQQQGGGVFVQAEPSPPREPEKKQPEGK